jgi:hypothetical protein
MLLLLCIVVHYTALQHKLRQQEALSKGLRRQQRTIKETEGSSTLQVRHN